MIHARDHTVCRNTNTIRIKTNPRLTALSLLIPRYLSSSILPAGLDAYPPVGVDTHRGAQHHGLGAQVVCHLDLTVHDGKCDVVRALHALPAPQHQPLGCLCPDAQLEFIHQESLFARRREYMCFQVFN